MRPIIAACLLAASTGAAMAGQTYDSTGTVTGKSTAEITPLGENHMVMLAPSTHDSFKMAADGHPFSDMSGACNGGVEFLNGAALGQGICVYQNAAGETMAVRWSGENISPDGTFHGQWIVIGGTGNLAGSVGGGDFSSVTDRGTGAQEIALTGAISTK